MRINTNLNAMTRLNSATKNTDFSWKLNGEIIFRIKNQQGSR